VAAVQWIEQPRHQRQALALTFVVMTKDVFRHDPPRRPGRLPARAGSKACGYDSLPSASSAPPVTWPAQNNARRSGRRSTAGTPITPSIPAVRLGKRPRYSLATSSQVLPLRTLRRAFSWSSTAARGVDKPFPAEFVMDTDGH
jgi:hypothetical protein